MQASNAKTAAADPAKEAWDALASLVYPPPFLVIARRLELGPSAFGALRILDRPRTMGDIARELRCDKSNVTGLVDGLEGRGLAERRRSASDRRVKLIALTAEGRRVRARLMRAVEKPPAWLASLPEADQAALRDILRRVERSSDGA